MSRLKRTGAVCLLAIASLGVRAQDATAQLLAAARSQIGVTVRYDPTYSRIAYPLGDVPIDRGVCTDVLIRAYRKLGIDLQQRVHEDMQAHWGSYPKSWGLKVTDPNIDHRRVPNLAVFFTRQGRSLPILPTDPVNYAAGDIVTWLLPGNLPHIGIVSSRHSGGHPLVIHNVGAGTAEEDALLAYPITGHFRYMSGAAPRVHADAAH
ncbi:MAG: DUF1287 domain-containing protein [Tahibacter sp.]